MRVTGWLVGQPLGSAVTLPACVCADSNRVAIGMGDNRFEQKTACAGRSALAATEPVGQYRQVIFCVWSQMAGYIEGIVILKLGVVVAG